MQQLLNAVLRAAMGTLRVVLRVGVSVAIGLVWVQFYARMAVPYVFPNGTPLTENAAMKVSEWILLASILLIFAVVWRIEIWIWPIPVVSQKDRIAARLARARKMRLWLRSKRRKPEQH
jgi:hypothetical protein